MIHTFAVGYRDLRIAQGEFRCEIVSVKFQNLCLGSLPNRVLVAISLIPVRAVSSLEEVGEMCLR